MDAVIGNKYNDVFSTLDIEVSKKLEGEFEVEEIISTFENFFFNKMFLDITSVKNYKNLTNLQKLSMGINMDKVILFLDKDDAISDSKDFLAKLVSMGIYNFTKDSRDLMYLYNNPNSYKDVAYLQNIEKSNDNVSINDISHDLPSKKRILGIKNVTDSAGSTTLVYLLKRVLSEYYSTMALEINKRDLTYFKDKDSLTVKDSDIKTTIDKYNSVDIFIVDLNKCKCEDICSDVLYLIEPSTIKLNKLTLINPNIFRELNGKKVVLNKSLLDKDDIANFEVESGLKIYYNIEPLNDKKDCSNKLLPLLEKLGYVKEVVTVKEEKVDKKSIFDLFKK